mmetsp:Transcript_112408/g.358964  ORF Transcript_112408/g.358964 Transcript_112408/m.358964 type:complete len:335 (+) Transcript_112408:31-1035(+)
MRWRWFVQQVLGGVRRIPGARARVVTGGALEDGRCSLGVTADSVRDLCSGEAPVLVCRGALPASLCEQAAERLEAVASLGSAKSGGRATQFAHWYLGADAQAPASDYTKLGYAKTDVFREEGVRMAAGRGAPERYLRRAQETRRFLDESVFAPHRSPISQIAEELSALPGISCRLERCPATGRDFLPCVVRRMVAGERRPAGNLHMDTAVPGRTLSVNVYLRVPEGDAAGGELVLYPVRKDALSRVLNSHFFTTVEIQNFYPGRSFYTDGLLASRQIEPIVYRPSPGDVVFIDPAYPHAVRDFQPASSCPARISLQTFVQISRQGGESVFEYAV